MYVGGMLFTWCTGGTHEPGQSNSYSLEYLQGDWGEGRWTQLKPELTLFRQITQDKAISGKFWEGLPHRAEYPRAAKDTRRDILIFERRGYDSDHQEDEDSKSSPKPSCPSFLMLARGIKPQPTHGQAIKLYSIWEKLHPTAYSSSCTSPVFNRNGPCPERTAPVHHAGARAGAGQPVHHLPAKEQHPARTGPAHHPSESLLPSAFPAVCHQQQREHCVSAE